MKQPLNVLVVGGGMYVTGRGTSTYGTIMPALLEARKIGQVGKIAIATTNKDSAEYALNHSQELADKMGVEFLGVAFPKSGVDEKAYLQACEQFSPDVAIVSVPDHLHCDVTVPLLDRGLHCLLVKPMASTLEEAKRMAIVAKKNNVVAEVEFHKRLDDSNLLLLDRIRKGDLGELLYAVIEYSQKKMIPTDIFRSWADQTNIFQYLGVHYVDLILYVTGFHPLKVTAWGQKEFLPEQGVDTWDSMQVVVEWEKENGKPFISTHITNWIDPNCTSAMSDQKINMVGTKGRFQADQKHRGVQIVLDDQGVQDVNPYFNICHQDPVSGKLTFSGYGISSILQFISDVSSFISGNIDLKTIEKERPSFQAALISTAVLEAAGESLRIGSIPVTIETRLSK
ncbi:MAG: Gfo/Idh/MocA family oxidoreductase [Nitrospina sp.]|nr:Gfo/Idh/MocA family oxidoreductase [Nitrospina sp.]